MNRTKIEWVKNPDGTQGFTSNPIKGYCPVACSYCYSRKDYDRRGWDKTIRWDDLEMDRLTRRQKPAGIFIGSMHEVFLDEYIEQGWAKGIVDYAALCPEHRIYLLTKRPQNLIKFSPFPDNCWVGVTATNREQFTLACAHLIGIKATVKFISLEPLLQRIIFTEPGEWGKEPYDWVIIGALTGTKADLLPIHHRTGLMMVRLNGNRWLLRPQLEWVEEIVGACDKAGIPVFLKDNLRPILKDLPESCIRWSGWGEGTHRELRQELPA